MPVEENKYLGYWSYLREDWFECDNIDEILNILCQEKGGRIGLWWDKRDICLSIHSDEMKQPEFVNYLNISVDQVYFRGLEGNEMAIQLIEINKYLYNFLDFFYGYGEYGIGMVGGPPATRYADAKLGSIKTIYWTNFFGPQLVEKFGKEKLLSSPSYITEELADGGIMLVRSPNPFTIDEPCIKAETIEKHLGIKR
ncbi:MAG: hypothetical protein AB1630_11495 [bacterium]